MSTDSKFTKGRTPSASCVINRHSRCTGEGHASPGNVKWVCTCSCHKVVPESEAA